MALKLCIKSVVVLMFTKAFCFACIASTNKQGVTTYKRHRFSTFTQGVKGIVTVAAFAIICKDVCMESTGKYWIPIYNSSGKDCNIVLAHPKYVKAIRGKKLARKMPNGLLTSSRHDLVAGSFMPPVDIRQLRDLMRYRFKLTCFYVSQEEPSQNCLTVSNIQLASVVLGHLW